VADADAGSADRERHERCGSAGDAQHDLLVENRYLTAGAAPTDTPNPRRRMVVAGHARIVRSTCDRISQFLTQQLGNLARLTAVPRADASSVLVRQAVTFLASGHHGQTLVGLVTSWRRLPVRSSLPNVWARTGLPSRGWCSIPRQ